MKDNNRMNFLIDAYKMRVQFFSDHANRTWTRFNILLTVELALSGLFFSILLDKGITTKSFWLLPAFGIVVSLIWYILGAQDRCAYLGYREQIHLVEKMVTKEVGATDLPAFNPSGINKYNWLTWRFEPISLSKLLALFPLLFAVSWAVLILVLVLR
jgi:hypothetical protein